MLLLGTLLLFRIHRLINTKDINVQGTEHSVIHENTVIQDQIVESSDCQSGKSLNGGLYLIESPATSVNFTNCKFSHCFSVYYHSPFSSYIYGGVLYFSNIENTFISGSSFVNCTSPCGGAIALSNVSLAVFENTNFTQNAASYFLFATWYGDGGAIYFDKTDGCSLVLTGCIFDSNIASSGAGLYLDPHLDELVVEDCSFTNNHNEHYYGAAIRAGTDIYTTPIKKVSLVSSSFTNNSITQGSEAHEGSACFIRAEELNLKKCNFAQHSGTVNLNCPVLSLTITNSTELLIDSCTYNNNFGSFVEVKGVYLDVVTIYNCNILNNQFYDKGVIYGDPLPSQLNFEDSVFTSNTGSTCHAITIPPGNIRNSTLINCVFNSIGVKASGPTVLIESFTEVLNTSFINHEGSALSIQVSKAQLLIKSLIFHNNSCTNPLAGSDGFLCEGSNISFVNADLSTPIEIKSANLVSIENSNINRFGLQVTSSYIFISNTSVFSLSGKSNLLLTAANAIFAKNVSFHDNSINYIQFNGQTNESKVEILDSSFKSSPIQISNSGFVYINNSQFNQCSGSLEGGAVHIGNQIDSAYIYKCTFTDCTSSTGNGGAIYANTVVNFNLLLSSFDKCKSKNYGSCLYLYGGLLSTINNCTFHNDDDDNSASIYIYDKSESCQTIFVNGCFSSNAQKITNGDVQVHHIYSASTGKVSFNYPMCFDRSKEDSVYFKNGQDADRGYDCYNCLDCGKMPHPGPTSIPSASPIPPTIVPTETPKPTDDDDSDSGNKKLKTPQIVGIVVGCVAAVIVIVVIIVIVVKRKKNNSDLDPSQLISPNTPIQLNTQENLPNNE